MAVKKARAWKTLESLSYERITGTEGEKKVAEQLKDMCAKLGVKAAIETYEIDDATIRSVSLTLEDGKKVTAYGLKHTGSTPKKGVTAPLKYIGDGSHDSCLLDVTGKIVLCTGRMNPKLAKKLQEKGAVAFITALGGFYDDDVIANGPRVGGMPKGANLKFPGVGVHLRDAEDLVKNHNGETVCLKLEQTSGTATGRNVVAVIPGTVCPEEEVVFSAHMDSVMHSKGSWDNASGCVTLLEIMQHYLQVKPERTLRFLWCGSEEIGLVGSRKYCEKHEEELKKVIYNINIDMVGVTLGIIRFCCSADDSVLHGLENFANYRGFPVKADLGTYSSDSSSFAAFGVPAASFGQESVRGGAEIHNYRDTMEHMDPDSLIEAIQFILDYATPIIAAKVNVIPRTFAAKVTESLERSKKMIAEMEGKDPEAEKKEAAAGKKPAGKAAAKKSAAKKPAARKTAGK